MHMKLHVQYVEETKQENGTTATGFFICNFFSDNNLPLNCSAAPVDDVPHQVLLYNLFFIT